MPGIQITSEVTTLEAVLVHTPGHEIEAVTPRTREDYLYDDIIGVEIAAREHARFVAVLERFSKVYQISDLLREVAELKEAREFLAQKTMDVVPNDVLAQRLSELPAADLVKLLIEGDEEIGG
ncbi:MAG: arginine deiminase family protein, partial [Gemmatimonadota bacterium]